MKNLSARSLRAKKSVARSSGAKKSVAFRPECVHLNGMDTTVNAILREWRDLWPGGLEAEQYSTLNLMAQCRQGTLGYNRARCE